MRNSVLIAFVLVAGVFGQDGGKPDMSVLAGALALAEDTDVCAAVEFLASKGDAAFVARACGELVRVFCFEKKDVARMTLVGRAGIDVALAEARRRTGAEADALRGEAKTLAYNLGANLWPGWGEEALVLAPSDLAVGLDCARLNLRLARELERDALPMGNAYWLLGAHLIAAGDCEAAAGFCESATRSFREAGAEDYALMGEGYAALARSLTADGAVEGEKQLAAAVDALRNRGSEDADFFAQQLLAAAKVFRKDGQR